MYSLLLTCWNNLAKFALAPSGLRVLNLLTDGHLTVLQVISAERTREQ